MILSTLPTLPGKEVREHLGLVSGNTVRTRHIGVQVLSGFRQMMGGELAAYTSLLNESRDQALTRMKEQATSLGANAILGVRFTMSEPAPGIAEIYVYGTAVKVSP